MAEDAERFYELRDDVSREAQIYADAAERPLPESATDESGTIDVAVDPDGLVTVTIADRWPTDYRPEELAETVLRIFQELAAARTAQWVTHLDSARGEDRRSTPIPPLGETTAGKLKEALDDDPDSAAEAAKVLENVLSILEDISANLDTTFDGALRHGRAAHRSEPDSRHLSVEVSGAGDLQGLTLSADWASRTSGTEISRELNEAIARAREQAAAGAAGPLDGTPLGKYQRFIDDPDSFVRFVRGKE